jgi:peroxiredoxin Q/BCP
MAEKGKVQVGDRAPAFTLHTQNGTDVSLVDFAGKSAVVLYFYPKDDCTPVASLNIGE